MTELSRTLSLFALLGFAALLLGLAARSMQARAHRHIAYNLGSLVQLALGLGALGLAVYVTLYFLGLVGGFYESLTCKVVTLPSCEDPLALPGWLRLPPQSVGGVIGILPLVAVFMAKALQRPAPLPQPKSGEPWWQSGLRHAGHFLTHNFGILLILAVEVWLAWLRGAAEAADREVRIALGLDSELPQAYLDIARWGAVVLALGLSAVVVYLGVLAGYAKALMLRALADLRYGAGLVALLGGLLDILAAGLVAVWTVLAIALGRLLLKAQDALYRLLAVALTALGRFLLKLQSFAYRSWAFLASTLGWTVIWLGRLGRRDRGSLQSLIVFLLVLGGGQLAQATTFVLLFDATGSEAGRLERTRQSVLSWADPSPQRALLERGDRLVVIPVRAPGNLDPTYSAVFNATYPSSQLERYEFFLSFRDALPTEVDSEEGTALSESLRAASVYLEEAEGERVLIVFGNGEDHSPQPVGSESLAPALDGAVVVHFNLGLEQRDTWLELYRQAGAKEVLLYDLAATRSLRAPEFREALSEALGG